MTEPESAKLTSPFVEKRVLFVGVMLASFMVCFIVFGCITYVDVSNLRNELRELKARDRRTFPAPTASYLKDLEDEEEEEEDDEIEEGEEDEEEEEEEEEDLDDGSAEAGVPNWVPSFPVFGYKPSPAYNNTGVESDEAHSRVRRSARACEGCCRDCDCRTKKRRKSAKGRRNCKRCCKTCGRTQKCKADGKDGERVKSMVNTIFKGRIGHFLGSNKTGSACGSNFKIDRPFALTTDTGDICAWEYATWMRKDAKELFKLDNNGKVKVRDAGMYYVYGQLIIYDSKPTASLGIMIRDYGDVSVSAGRERELSKCIETAGYLIGEHGVIADTSGSFRTCNMGSLTELYAGSEVYIVVHLPKTSGATKIPVKTFHNVTTAFFGIIKYT